MARDGSALPRAPGPLALLMLLLVAPFALVPIADPGQAAVPHGPIAIEGDDAPCSGGEDGVVNCGEADGSPERPFIIAGWDIDVPDGAGCDSAARFPPLAEALGCTPLPHCPGLGTADAALSICATNHTIIVRDVRIVVAERSAAPGILVVDAPNVRIEDVSVAAAGHALRVSATGDGPVGVHVLRSTLRASEAPPSANQPVVRVAGGSLVLEDSHIEASGRLSAVKVEGRPIANDTLRVSNGSVSGAVQRGIDAFGVHVDIQGVTITGVGQSGVGTVLRDPTGGTSLYVDGSSAAYLDIAERPYRFTDNVVEVRGVGLNVVGSGQGQVEWNRFLTGDAPADLRPVAARFAEEACRTRFQYNDLDPGMRLFHALDSGGCALDARHVWWGQPEGPNVASWAPQIEGLVNVDPWLRVPTVELPAVRVLEPAPGSSQVQEVRLAGTAAGAPSHPVERVEVTVGQNWSAAQQAAGAEVWMLELDLEPHGMGPLSLAARACGRLECGAPVQFTVVHVPVPSPPVAVLAASPRVVQVDAAVVLDGSASYATDGGQVAWYRFAFGDGRGTDWQEASVVEVHFAGPGRYVPVLEVRDALGTASMNRAIVVVHVREAGDPALSEVGAVPAASMLAAAAAVAAIGAVAGVLRRR